MQLDIKRLIADFGGPSQLADALQQHFPDEAVSRAAVYKWREAAVCRYRSYKNLPNLPQHRDDILI